MACIITLMGFTPFFVSGNLAGFGIQGIVTPQPPSPICNPIEIAIACGSIVFNGTLPVFQTGADGFFSGVIGDANNPPPAGLLDCCNENLTVTIGCLDCGYQTYLIPLNRGGACPYFWGVTCSIGQCRFDGTVDLTCSAQFNLGSNTSIDVQWQLDNTPISPVTTVTASGTISSVLNVVGDGLNHTLTLNVVQPTGCPPIGVIITLPTCGGCSPINFNYQPGNCNANGTRNVVITAVLTG